MWTHLFREPFHQDTRDVNKGLFGIKSSAHQTDSRSDESSSGALLTSAAKWFTEHPPPQWSHYCGLTVCVTAAYLHVHIWSDTSACRQLARTPNPRHCPLTGFYWSSDFREKAHGLSLLLLVYFISINTEFWFKGSLSGKQNPAPDVSIQLFRPKSHTESFNITWWYRVWSDTQVYWNDTAALLTLKLKPGNKIRLHYPYRCVCAKDG